MVRVMARACGDAGCHPNRAGRAPRRAGRAGRASPRDAPRDPPQNRVERSCGLTFCLVCASAQHQPYVWGLLTDAPIRARARTSLAVQQGARPALPDGPGAGRAGPPAPDPAAHRVQCDGAEARDARATAVPGTGGRAARVQLLPAAQPPAACARGPGRRAQVLPGPAPSPRPKVSAPPRPMRVGTARTDLDKCGLP